MDNMPRLAALLLHSSVNTTIMLVDAMFVKNVVSAGEAAAMLLEYSDRLQEDAENLGIDAHIQPHIDQVHAKIEHLRSFKKP
ncbi:hypothetical protein Brsp07_01886 [Brucella sp. NBRC 14130]|uniref:hypothetical protein n=1 Tax=Brucella sp. NBRC 14130 TaxID=3075483 RepID=UPI0030A12988